MSETNVEVNPTKIPAESDEIKEKKTKRSTIEKKRTNKRNQGAPSVEPMEKSSESNTAGEIDNQKTPEPMKNPVEEVPIRAGHDVDVVFLDQLDKAYECINCNRILRVPFLFEDCGHRCCSGCVPDIFRGTSKCPVDKKNLKKDRVHLDKAFQEHMDSLGVKCSYHTEGCLWTGILGELGSHLNQCEYKILSCPRQCGIELQRRYLEKHIQNDCAKRVKQCQYCGTKLLSANEIKHSAQCTEYPIPCPNKCEKTAIPRGELTAHLKNECSKQYISCPFYGHGCGFRGRKHTIDPHIEQSVITHLNLINASIKQMSLLIEAQTKSYAEVRSLLESQIKRTTALERGFGATFLWKIDSFAEKLNLAKSGKQNAIFSPPFYTHRYGYRMALSVSLYGNGDAFGKFMSVYACLFRGDHDSLLEWPFSHQLTFTLIDQNPVISARKPINYTIKPNLTGDYNQFLGKPTTERNSCFGAPRFVKLETLETSTYVVNDEIYLKIEMNLDRVASI
uniref:TNF receptor-associated factor n=2 Tax=Trichobilharzia regenti TaxID=157069 RepID=A0AA85JRY1_TRIRE|nr:unnamed protein product [Trichobilharzia regenti]